MARDKFDKRKELLARGFDRKIKKRIVKSLVWSVALYDVNTWMLLSGDIERPEAFEMWLWMRVEITRCTERVAKATVLQRLGENRRLLIVVRQRQKWLGHIMRGEHLLYDRLM